MWQKRILGSLWIITMLIIFIVTFVNNKPYFIMGGSTSVSPLMHTLMDGYPENHKDADFTYNSLGSDAAIIPVDKGMFGIGWLSKEYTTSKPNQISFVLSLDGMILVYNLPSSELGNDSPLNFNQDVVKKMYLTNGNVYWKDLFPQNPSQPDQGWVKPTSTLKVTTYTRENGSGTRDVFNEKVLGDKTAYYPQATTVNSSTQMFSMAPGGIGYSSYSDRKQLDSNPLFANVHIGDWNGITPTLDTIKGSGGKTYELSRPFTGVINEKYKQINILVKFLKFLFDPANPIVNTAFNEDNYAQAAVPLTDPKNKNLDTWLSSPRYN